MTEIKTTVSRRAFLKLSGTSMGALAAMHFLPPRVAEAARAAGMLDARGDGVIPTMCEMCVWRCGVLAKVQAGRVVKLEGNPAHPHSKGKLCARGQSGLMTTYDPDRVLTPLVRVGPRGGGQFRKISWDDALDLVAEKMQAIKQNYGPEAMVFSSTHNLSQVQFENLLYGFGSPNYGTQRSLCFNAMVTAFLLTYGVEEPSRKYDEVEYVLLVGRNLLEAISTSETSELVDAVARGAKLVVLDPRFTKTASKATEWIPIRPGTDSAFLLAMINVIVTERIGACEFVQEYVLGCDGLPQAMAAFTPEWAETKTGVPAATIRRIAREFAAAKPHTLAHPGWRTSNFVNSFQTERAIATLNAIVGNVFEPDGCLSAVDPEASSVPLGKPAQPAYPRVTALRLDGVPWQYPLVPLKLGIFQNIREAILSGKPYQAHGWLVSRQNPVLSIPDRKRTLEALSKLDFIAVIDVIMNDTSWFADVVLPEASYLERYDPLSIVDGKVYLRQPAVEPMGEGRSALWIYKQLGERLGLGDFFRYEDEEDYLNQQLAPLGVNLEDIRGKGTFAPPAPAAKELAFNTPSGKIEVYSDTLARAGFSGYPTWEEPPAPQAGSFYLLTGKVGQHTQMATQNNKFLHAVEDAPRLWLHPAPAAELGIRSDDAVRVTSPVGKVEVQALVTEAIRPDCVYLTPGYGHLSKGLRVAYGHGASDSELHVTYTDPVSGGQALSQTFVTIEKA
jgi:thiosulfate reductase/polysulfide reductase chain A